MALFTPVDERRFAFDKTVGRCHSEAVVVKAFFDYRIYVLQPLPVAGHFIQFVGCDSPDFPVGAYWPGAAAAGILNYTPPGVTFFISDILEASGCMAAMESSIE